MEHSNFPLKEFLVELYTGFEASMRDAFLATVMRKNSRSPILFIRLFDQRCLELSERYLSLINMLVLMNSENDAEEELTRFSLILKQYISEDIQNMKRLMKTFIMRASGSMSLGQNTFNIRSEILAISDNPKVYNLEFLGRASPRVFYV